MDLIDLQLLWKVWIRKWWLLGSLFWLVGCAPQTVLLPTRMAAVPLPEIPTATAVSTQPALPPTAIPPTLTPETAVAHPSRATSLINSTPPKPTATAIVIPPTNDDECRSASLLAPVQPQWRVKDGPWPRRAAASGLLGRASDNGLKLLHLGFDVEGDPFFMGDLLDVLDQRQVKTTMFMLGSWADTYPEWVQEIARRGHEMATHGYSHADMAEMTAEQVNRELRSTEAAIVSLTGQSTQPWLRPPFGSYSDVSMQAAYDAGYTTVIWTGSSNDWRSNMDADKMCEALRYYAVPGAILYAHTNRADIVEAVDRFIAEMQTEGYTFVPLSVLMSPDPAAWLEPVNGER